MTLMRFDPFRELDRLADQALVGARTARTLLLETLQLPHSASLFTRR